MLMLLLKSSLLWHLQAEVVVDNSLATSHYRYHLSKMSRVCMFVAETCGKCTQLKSCFWCANDGAGEGRCYANSDSVAKDKCVGKVYAYWQKVPCLESEYLVRDGNTERSVLMKLLLLLRKLRNSGNTDLFVQEIPDMFKTEVLNEDIASEAQMGHPLKPTQGIRTSTNFFPTSLAFNEIHNHTYNASARSHIYGSTTVSSTSSTLKSYTNSSRTNNGSFRNTSAFTSGHITRPVTVNSAIRLYHAPCYGMTRPSCLREAICSWCRGNTTCCRWRPRNIKKKAMPTTSGHNDMVCPKVSSCQACISRNDKCYWCSAGSMCQLYPGESYVKMECDGQVSYKTCAQDIPVYIFALCIILVTLFLSFGYLCARKCYYFQLKPVEVKLEERPILFKKKNGRTVYQITESEEEEEEELFSNGKDAYTPNKVGLAPNNPAVW